MNILHITPHCGGGVGTVICDWVNRDVANHYTIALLEYANEKLGRWGELHPRTVYEKMIQHTIILDEMISVADVVVLNYWDHPLLAELFSRPIPECRLAFWLHKNTLEAMTLPVEPDRVIKTSPVQGAGKYIWSCGDMSRFFEIQPKPHRGFNVGYCGTVDYTKMHPDTLDMCRKISQKIPDVHFTFVGGGKGIFQSDDLFTFTGKVDDVAPYLAEMDIFFYPLRPDNYGTCEQVLGEAMASGVVPVVWANPAERLIVESYKNGIIAFNEREYIEGIRYLSQNPDELKCASEMARKRAKEIYNIDTMIHQWDDVFENMMKEPKKKRGTL